MSYKVEEDCTHVILEDWDDSLDCSKILQMVKAAGGIESLEHFRNRLKSKLSFVHSRSCLSPRFGVFHLKTSIESLMRIQEAWRKTLLIELKQV